MKSSLKFSVMMLASVMLLAGSLARGQSEAETLAKQVEIRRTMYGVPHIWAETEKAAAFGFGYCQAEDHLPSIMRLILTARGELSKNFEDRKNIDSDFEVRQFRVYERARETYHKLEPEFRGVLEGYAAGMNLYIEKHRAELPEWIQPINGHDVAAHGMMGVMRFAFDRGGIVKRFQAKMNGTKETSGIFEESEREVGSNMWALGPKHTKSGKAILLGNPHQGWAEVSTYYEAHVTVPGVINFYGSTFVGRPILTTGFNEHLGWTHTVNYPDLEEIYEIARDPKDKMRFIFDGTSHAIREEKVTIDAKVNGEMMGLTRTFIHTHLGPVIYENAEKIYVLRSACYEDYRAYEQWYKMSKTKTFEEFRAALDMLAVPMFNICYADREGNIFYIWNGMIPRLPHPAKNVEAVPAAGSSDIWTRFHSVNELPQLFNPRGHYVQNCNSPFHYTNLNAVFRADDFPAYMGAPANSLRTQLSLQMVDNDRWFSLEDVRDMKFNPRMLVADRVKGDLLEILKADGSAEFAESIALLEKWNNTGEAESRGSVLFATWWDDYAGSYPNFKSDAFAEDWTTEKPMDTPRGIGNKARAVEAFRRAMDTVKKDYGAIDVAWGEVHRVRKGNVDVPVSGGSGFHGFFRVLDFKKAEDGKKVVTGGDSWIFAVEFGKTPKAYSVTGYSQSEIEGSPYYNDQSAMFASNQMKPVAFTEEDIQRQLLRSYRPGE